MSNQPLNFRNATIDDAKIVIQLMDRCEIAEYGESDSDIEDLLHNWERINLSKDVTLALTPGGELVGYAAVMPWAANLNYDFFADPNWSDDSLGRQMLAFCIQRGPAFARENDIKPKAAIAYIAHPNQRNREIVGAAGFQPKRYHFQMQIDLETLLPAPHWPDGISIRNAAPEQDGPQIHKLVETAFARPDRTPTTFDDWKDFMLRPDIFDAALWHLAVVGETLAGVCLGFAYPEIGWVRQLAVADSWRRQGLGSALLNHAFRVFKERGYAKAGLAVAGENQNAYRLYQKAGMKRLRQYDQYEIALMVK